MASLATSNPIFIKLRENRGMIFPLAFISLLMVILVPLPPAVLDFLLIVNITLSVIVMVTTIYVQSAVILSAGPFLRKPYTTDIWFTVCMSSRLNDLECPQSVSVFALTCSP